MILPVFLVAIEILPVPVLVGSQDGEGNQGKEASEGAKQQGALIEEVVCPRFPQDRPGARRRAEAAAVGARGGWGELGAGGDLLEFDRGRRGGQLAGPRLAAVGGGGSHRGNLGCGKTRSQEHGTET